MTTLYGFVSCCVAGTVLINTFGQEADSCKATEALAATLRRQRLTPELRAKILARTGTVELRTTPDGGATSSDYVTGRVTIVIDTGENVVDVFCG